MADVTQILSRIEQGYQRATDQLLPLFYNELRELAAAKLAHEKPGHTLQAPALVDEAYLRLVRDGQQAGSRDKRGHFMGIAPTPEKSVTKETRTATCDYEKLKMALVSLPLSECDMIGGLKQ